MVDLPKPTTTYPILGYQQANTYYYENEYTDEFGNDLYRNPSPDSSTNDEPWVVPFSFPDPAPTLFSATTLFSAPTLFSSPTNDPYGSGSYVNSYGGVSNDDFDISAYADPDRMVPIYDYDNPTITTTVNIGTVPTGGIVWYARLYVKIKDAEVPLTSSFLWHYSDEVNVVFADPNSAHYYDNEGVVLPPTNTPTWYDLNNNAYYSDNDNTSTYVPPTFVTYPPAPNYNNPDDPFAQGMNGNTN